MMKRELYGFMMLFVLLSGCKEESGNTDEIFFDKALTEELEKMVEIDQVAANVRKDSYKEWSNERWDSFKDSVFTTHQKRVAEIFEEYGFPGFDRVGENGSQHFWLLVQHSDHDPDFQRRVLEKMKVEVDKQNAKPTNYALLVDRVNLNTGKPQVYGTQVTYRSGICQAYPKSLADSAGVNERRKAMGLSSLEEYLNQMTELHFEINKESFLSQGIKEPSYYPIEKDSI